MLLSATPLDHSLIQSKPVKRPKYWDYLWTQERAELQLILSQLACVGRFEGKDLRKRRRVLANRATQRIWTRK